MTNPRAAIFAEVDRAKPGVWNAPGAVATMDAALDGLGVAREAVASADGRRISDAGLKLIRDFEGCRLTAYPDPGTGGHPWTIGVGHTGADVRPGLTITDARANELLRADVARFESAVNRLAPVTTQAQFDALVSFAFNVGDGALSGSTLLKRHNAGVYSDAAAEFGKWDKAGGRRMAGLTRRRSAEAALYRGERT